MPLIQRQIIAFLLLGCIAFAARGETLHLVTEAWAPYVYEEDGQAAGLDYEITREVLRRLGMQLDLQFCPGNAACWRWSMATPTAFWTSSICPSVRRACASSLSH